MTQHDGSTNTEAFVNPEHAMLCGAVSMVLYLNFPQFEVIPATTDNDDYLPAVEMTHRETGRMYLVSIEAAVIDQEPLG